jgi:RNA polymerase sigma-70 factor, ECF subfamily
MPDDAEVRGLLALLLLHDARCGARVDRLGRYVPIDEQDRSLWDQGRIREGLKLLTGALARGRPRTYQLQAAIAALHVVAPSPEETDWARIATLYAALNRVAPSPVVDLNHAVAVARADGPHAGLALLAVLLADPRLTDYQPLHAAHADLLRRAGDLTAAAAAYVRAIELSTNAVERTELERRLAGIS